MERVGVSRIMDRKEWLTEQIERLEAKEQLTPQEGGLLGKLYEALEILNAEEKVKRKSQS